MPFDIKPNPKSHRRRFVGLTLRSVAIGVLIAVIVDVWGPFSIYRLHSSLVTDDYVPLAVVFLFLLVVVGLNVVLKLINPKFALSPSELIIIFIRGFCRGIYPYLWPYRASYSDYSCALLLGYA